MLKLYLLFIGHIKNGAACVGVMVGWILIENGENGEQKKQKIQIFFCEIF